MSPAIYLVLFLCTLCAVLAAMPMEPATVRLRGPIATANRRRRPRVLNLLLTTVGQIFPRWSPAKQEDDELRNRLIYTGSQVTVEAFRGIKLLLAAGCCVAFAVSAAEFGWLNPVSLTLAAAIGFFVPDLWLRARLARRQQAILRLLPEVVDLLTLCIGAGLDFLLAINKVVSIKKFQGEPLVEELSVALQEMKLGKRRMEALKAMAKRVNLQVLSSFVRTVVQADRMGTPISEVLAVHAEDVRLQRMTRAERAALKAPIKILFPLIFCIMPCVAIIVGAPIFMQFMQQSPFSR